MPAGLLPTVLIIAVSAIGGYAADQLGLPMPWLLGALLASAAMSMRGAKLLAPLNGRLPELLIMPLVAIVGVEIGSTFTVDIAKAAIGWWPSLVGVVIFVFTAQTAGYFTLRAMDRGTGQASAWFAAAPGGLLENVILGKEAGGSERYITTIQFLRLIAIILVLPLGFSIWAGQQVGSAAGFATSAEPLLGAMDAVILLGCALIGRWVGGMLKVPAHNLVGPLILSAIAHVALNITGSIPWALIVVAQVVIGAGLGLAFQGFTVKMLLRALIGVICLVTSMLILTAVFAFTIAAITGLEIPLLILSFAPAGVIEMSLIALTLGIDPVFVTTHHILRILVTVLVTPFLFRALIAARQD